MDVLFFKMMFYVDLLARGPEETYAKNMDASMKESRDVITTTVAK